jgi:2-phosphoglycolate phosphatase
VNESGPRAVAFDLDGTLVDSRLDLAAAVNLARADFDLPPHPVEAVLGMVGEGARNLVRRAFGEPEPARLERALERFFVHYDVECTRRTRPYAGIEAATLALAGRFPLAIVTNKPERFSRKIVDALGWRGRFVELVGGDSLPSRKPDPAGLCEVARRLGLPPAELLFVGDSRIDSATAGAAGAPFVFVEWGFAGEAERRELAAARSVREPAELLELVPPAQRIG